MSVKQASRPQDSAAAKPKIAVGLDDVQIGARRKGVRDSWVIKSHTHVDSDGANDVNQLFPIVHEFAWEHYRNTCKNSWFPYDIGMVRDIAQWPTLSDDERGILERTLGFLSTADSLVANNLVLGMYKNITSPECRLFLLRQAFEEAVHMESYSYIVQSLGLDEAKIFNMYREIKSMADKANWSVKFTRILSDPAFETGTLENDQKLLRDLIAFYLVFEGIFFYVGFVQVLSMGRRNLMPGACEQIQYIFRDESLHLNFGVDLVNQIIKECPELWTEAFQAEVRQIIKEGVALEYAYAEDTMPQPILGLNKEMFKDYLQYIGNRRLKQIGLEEEWPGAQNPFPWMSELIDLKKEKNFFETRVTEYQTGSALDWDE
ncbi:MAG: ribonucleotide-diphosphate reductase subunit beta [Pseudomonadota bacterium]|nr:ribonucleotide-diphosphate reductase subunit beta [Pseudomonadota bacterium]